MTVKNEIQKFAVDPAAQVYTADEWSALTKRVTGYANGIVDQKSFNTPHRQASFVANMIAQFTCDYAAADVLDNGDSATFETNFVAALTKAVANAFAVGLLHYCVDGDASANVLDISGTTPVPDFTALRPGTTLLIRVLTTNTAAVSVVMPHSLGTLSLINPDGSGMSSGQLHAGGLALCAYDGAALQLLASMNASGTVSITNASSGEGISVQTVSPYAVSINFPGLTHNATIHDTDVLAYYNGTDGHHRGITWAEIKTAILAAISFPSADAPLSRDGTTGHYKIARATVDKNGVGVGHAATPAEIAAKQTDPAGDGPAFLRADDISSLPGVTFGYGVGQCIEMVLPTDSTGAGLASGAYTGINKSVAGSVLKNGVGGGFSVEGSGAPYIPRLGVTTCYAGSLPPDNAVYRVLGYRVTGFYKDTTTTITWMLVEVLYKRES